MVARVLPRALKLIGAEATLGAFREHAPGASYLHLATHGEFRGDDPHLSSLHLADAPVNLHELYDLNLSARLVVLSGCQTAMGRASAGEELVGLSHGFLHAGAGSLVVSLWAVNDRSTAELMSGFYGRVAGGLPPASALRQAMIAHRERHPHPYFWAPFVLIGG
jgi:CHAT domain-containing protein